MKKLAARDFEDLLQVNVPSFSDQFTSSTSSQCSFPVFEGLLPEPHNTIVLQLLFTLATWHALAKLAMHTDTTLVAFEATVTRLGKAI